jgi:hypothetical protein
MKEEVQKANGNHFSTKQTIGGFKMGNVETMEMYCKNCDEVTEWELYDYNEKVLVWDCCQCENNTYYEER